MPDDPITALDVAAEALGGFWQLTRRADGRGYACLVGTIRRGWEGYGRTAHDAARDVLAQVRAPARAEATP
jgi:hypothetical protein